MDMERVRSSIIAALLFLTLVALAAAGASGGNDAAAAVVEPYYMQLGAANTTAAADEQASGYMLFGLQTGGIGDKVRLVVVADQRYFFITGFGRGLSKRPSWSFRDGAGDRHRLLPLGSSSRSHAEVVASNVLRALIHAGKEAGF